MTDEYNFKRVTPRQERGTGYVGLYIGQKYRINFSKGFCKKFDLADGEYFDLYCDAKKNALKIYFHDTGDYATKITAGMQVYNSCTSGLKDMGMKQGRYVVEKTIRDDEFILVME